MRPFVEALKAAASEAGQGSSNANLLIRLFLQDRDERFREGNDKTWGAGNWVRYDRCLDSLGYPAYHHKEHHVL